MGGTGDYRVVSDVVRVERCADRGRVRPTRGCSKRLVLQSCRLALHPGSVFDRGKLKIVREIVLFEHGQTDCGGCSAKVCIRRYVRLPSAAVLEMKVLQNRQVSRRHEQDLMKCLHDYVSRQENAGGHYRRSAGTSALHGPCGHEYCEGINQAYDALLHCHICTASPLSGARWAVSTSSSSSQAVVLGSTLSNDHGHRDKDGHKRGPGGAM